MRGVAIVRMDWWWTNFDLLQENKPLMGIFHINVEFHMDIIIDDGESFKRKYQL